MAEYKVGYAKTATLEPNVVDRVTFDMNGHPRLIEEAAAAEVAISNHSEDTPIYFDFTYVRSDKSAIPAPSGDIVPEADNTFVVLPRESKHFDPPHAVIEFTLVASGAAKYTVMLLT